MSLDLSPKMSEDDDEAREEEEIVEVIAEEANAQEPVSPLLARFSSCSLSCFKRGPLRMQHAAMLQLRHVACCSQSPALRIFSG